MSLEQELLDATGLKQDKFPNRRKLLEAIVRVINKLPEDEYDDLTDPAIEWYEASVKAMNKDKSPPEFPDLETVPPKPAPDEGEDANEDSEPDEGDEDEFEENEEEAQVAEPTGDAIDEAARGGDSLEEPEDDAEPAPTPKKQKKVKKAKAPTKAELERAESGPTRYEKMIKYGGTKNRYGIYEGTKAHDAIMMFEKGATMAEIRDAVGDSKYNLLRDLKKAGHLVEKDGRKFMLIHKSDAGKTKKKK